MNIQWYPGHMKKALEEIKTNLKLVDTIIEIVDARCPCASRNPAFDDIIKMKNHIIILNKADLADEKISKKWSSYFKSKGKEAITFNAVKSSPNIIISAVERVSKEVNKKRIEKGQRIRAIRTMVIGVPNSGKSSIINNIIGKSVARTGNKPGVTRGKQWVRINKKIELFDTPGILWPKFEDENVAFLLALTSSINDKILDLYKISLNAINLLKNNYEGLLNRRYSIDESEIPEKIFESIAKKRGCILKGSKLDYDRASRLIVDEIRNGKLGRISFEQPN